jgi:hypothetical protein
VEGLPRPLDDRPGNAAAIAQDVTRGNTDDGKSALPESPVSMLVARDPLPIIMHHAVNLDDETSTRAVEIHDIWIDRVLPPES